MAEKNIVRSIKHYKLNIALIIVGLFVIYLIIIIIAYAKQKHITPYMVENCTFHDDTVYVGISIREENIMTANTSGYIDYYANDNEKARADATIYTIDETGEFTKLLSEKLAEGNETLGEKEWSELKNTLYNISLNYSDQNFENVYHEKKNLDNKIADDFYQLAIRGLNQAVDTSGYIRYVTDHSAIIQYEIDGFENVEPFELTKENFDQKNYTKTELVGGSLVSSGNAVYKEITSDEWKLVFPCSEQLVGQIGYGATSIAIHLTKLNRTLTLPFSYVTSADGNTLGCIYFKKYLTDYLDDRFVEFEIVTNDVTGLLIPKTAVTNQEFYLVPASYFYFNDNNEFGALYVDASKGDPDGIFTTFTFYGKKDGSYLVSMTDMTLGDYLLKRDSQERYYISPVASLQGVYNVNQGYTLFRQINIIAELDDMYVLSPDYAYSVSKYDYIALDASFVKEFQLTR